jgi:hypothetical protein
LVRFANDAIGQPCAAGVQRPEFRPGDIDEGQAQPVVALRCATRRPGKNYVTELFVSYQNIAVDFDAAAGVSSAIGRLRLESGAS